MPRNSIKSILMSRDGMTEKEANEAIQIARDDFNERLSNGEMPDDICEEHFNLEPDYLDEFLF